jgi:hypothetical protein
MAVFRRILTTAGAVLALTGLVRAQDPATAPQTNVPRFVEVDASLRNTVVAYEFVLKDAMDQAGTKLAAWAQQIAPEVYLVRAASPVVTSMLLPDNSMAFEVRISEILPTSLQLFDMYARQAGPGQNAQNASNIGSKATAMTQIPPADPVTVPPPPPVVAPGATGAATNTGSLNPGQQYSDFVREAIINTLVDSAMILPIKEGQWLTVQVTPVDVAITNPLYKNPSRRLILSIKGDDLAALRQKTITREEARLRVVERRF